MAKKYNFNDIEYLERIIKAQISKKERSNDNSRIAKKIFENQTDEEYERSIQQKKEKLIERNQIKAIGGEKYYELLLNIVERLERIEKKIDGYDFTE